jgi:hypothetical protein
MTDDRNLTEANDLLSATYREIAAERVSEQLNKKILKMAANPAPESVRASNRFSVSLLSVWTKPVAWIATLGLCAVVVFNVNQTQVPTGQGTETTSAPDSVSAQFVPRDARTIEAAREQARRQNGPNKEQTNSGYSGLYDPVAEDDPACDSEVRASDIAWFDCIRALREANQLTDAEREYASFQLEYPAFLHDK